jgi:hypothetical protein
MRATGGAPVNVVILWPAADIAVCLPPATPNLGPIGPINFVNKAQARELAPLPPADKLK